MKPRLLAVVSPRLRSEFARVSRLADILWFDELSGDDLRAVLPTVDCMFVHFWSKTLGDEMFSKMKRLKFIQYGMAGVDGIPLSRLGTGVVVSSNAGGYSQGVGEYAFALLLAAAKKIVRDDREIRQGGWSFKEPFDRARGVWVLRGKKLGIVGFGGIGRAVAEFARGFGMETMAFTRNAIREPKAQTYNGRAGLEKMLGSCDAFILALPLTKKTKGLIGRHELSLMKRDVVLVNIGRAELIEENALYEHLQRNADFVYATDVWWTENGKEIIPARLPFTSLKNFIGTPHTAGPSSLLAGEPIKHACENIERFLKGKRPSNVIDKEEYV